MCYTLARGDEMNKMYLIASFTALLLFLCGCGLDTSVDQSSKNDGSKESSTSVPKEGEANSNETEQSTEEKKPEPDTDTYVIEDGKFTYDSISFDIPSEFELIEAPEEESGSITFGFQNDTAAFVLVVDDLSYMPNLTPDAYVEMAKQQAGIDFLSNRKYEVNGIETYELVSHENNKIVQNIFIHDEKAFTFSFGLFEDEINPDNPFIKSIVNSVSFE